METGVMSSGAGEVGGLVNEQVQIQRTPVAGPSVQAAARLADFPLRNNLGRSCAASPGSVRSCQKILTFLIVMSATGELQLGSGGGRRMLDRGRRATARRQGAAGVAKPSGGALPEWQRSPLGALMSGGRSGCLELPPRPAP